MAVKGNQLSKKVVGAMWRLFSQGMSEQAISRKCAVCRNTVHKYRVREGWDDRRQRIITKAETKADEQQVTLLAENMMIAKVAKQKLFDQIKSKSKSSESKTPFSDIDRIIRLEEFLQGRPDSRPQIDFSQLSEEQLTIEVKAMIMDLMQIPECRQELQKLLSSGTE